MPVDALGRLYQPPSPPARVVSLVPSLTESIFDLGAGDSLVGITDFCIFPSERVQNLPRVGGTKTPDIAAMRSLEPDLVYLNLEENLRRHGEAIAQFAPTFVTEPKSVDDVVALLGDLGQIHGVSAASAVSSIQTQLAGRSRETFTFAAAIWKQPWMWCGADTYVSSLVSASGGRNVLNDVLRYPTRTLDQVAELQPDVVFLPDEPYVFTPSDALEVQSLLKCRVIGPFPGHLFTWHGTRTILGLQFLREVLRVGPVV